MPSTVSVPSVSGIQSGLPGEDDSILSTLNAITGGLGSLGSVLGKQAQGDANAKVSQAQLNNQADQTKLGLYNDQQNAQNQAAQLDLQRQGFTTNNRAANAKQALIAQLLGGMSPTKVSVPGITTANVGGGAMGSLLHSPGLLQTLQTLSSQANGALANPQAFTGGAQIAAPTLTPVPDVTNGGVKAKTGGLLQDLGAIAGPILKVLKFL